MKGLSQEQLADELRITRSRVGGYEEARNEPPIDILDTPFGIFSRGHWRNGAWRFEKNQSGRADEAWENRILFPIFIEQWRQRYGGTHTA